MIMRKYLPIVVVVLVVALGILTWRRLHPPLTDEQQILVAIEEIQEAARNRSPRGIANFLAKEFKVGETGKSEFQNSLAAGILQYRVIDLDVPNPKISISGDSAQSSGQYVLSLKSEFNSPPQITRGQVSLRWKKIEGEWLIVRAEADMPSEP